MKMSNLPYNHDSSDFTDRAAFCDSHGNISISAVISSSCVVLEGLRDNTSDCLSTVFPLGQDGQSFFTSDIHNSMPSSLRNGNFAMLNTSVSKLGVNKSLESPSTGPTYENHFFESAATEFTTAGNEMGEAENTGRPEIQFSTENEIAVGLPLRPYFGDNTDDMDNDNCAMNSFTHSNKLLNKNGYVFCSPHRDINNEYSRNCRSNTAGSIFYSSSQDNVSTLDPPYECDLLSKTGTATSRGSVISFMPIVHTDSQRTDRNLRSWRNENCIQSRTPSPSKDMPFSGHQGATGDALNTHYDVITLQKRFNVSPHILESDSGSFSTQSDSLVSYTKNSSFQQYSLPQCEYESSNVSEVIGGRSLGNSLSDNSSMHGDSFRHVRPQLPCPEETINNRAQINDVKYSTVENRMDSIQSMREKYTSGKFSKYTSKKHFLNENTNIARGQENYNFISSPNNLTQNDTVNNITNIDGGSINVPISIVSIGKAKRKHAETVESLQQHLEMLEGRRKKTGPTCSSVSMIRQRSQAAEEKVADDDRGALIVDVDHMMCSGVTVAGFKPRAIIRKRIKTATPTDIKDTEYWQKRRKNNDSARKSRESKKEKEKNFYKRALELEYENLYLQECLSMAEAELANLGHSFVPPVFGGTMGFMGSALGFAHP